MNKSVFVRRMGILRCSPLQRPASRSSWTGRGGSISRLINGWTRVTIGWGATARFDDVGGRPDLEGSVRYLTGPSQFEASLRNSWYTSDRLRLGIAGSRETRTMDGWIRPTWYNSLSTLVADDDTRNYYRGDRAGIEVEWRGTRPPIWEDAPEWSLSFAGFFEDAKSLEARDTWAVFKSPAPDDMPAARHPNPAVDDGGHYRWSPRTTG